MSPITLDQANTYESLPAWMADERFPDWLRSTRYAHVNELDYCAALVEVRRGFRDQQSFDKLISTRKANTKARARKKAAADALSPEAKEAKAVRIKQQQRLSRLTAAVTMHTRIVAEDTAKHGANDVLFTANSKRQLHWAKERLAAHVEAELKTEFATLDS